MKRMHRLVLPTTLLVAYFTAVGLGNPALIELFSRVGLAKTHRFAGFLLMITGCVLLYDFLSRKYAVAAGRMVVDGEKIAVGKPGGKMSFRRLVDLLFYALLTIMCILGLVLYGSLVGFAPLFPGSEISIRLLHSRLGWFLISVLILKYYVTITQWFDRLMDYLKTH